MRSRQLSARVNIRLIVILSAVVILLGVSAFVAREIRRSMIKSDALAQGNAAYEKGDWKIAGQQFKRYLEKDQTNVEVLDKFAQANLNLRPVTVDNLNAAIWAYRRILRIDADSISAFEALAELYIATQNSNELAYIGRRMSERHPEDPRGSLWLATSLLSQQKLDEASQTLEQLETKFRPAAGQAKPEYLDACSMLASIEMRSDSPGRADRARGWLDRAVAAAPDSAYALINRARFHRQQADNAPAGRAEQFAAAKVDLEKAANTAAQDPRDALSLAREWLAWGDLDRTISAIRLVKSVDPAEIKRRFADLDDWTTAVFLLEADLALRKGSDPGIAALADQALGKLTYEVQRFRVLPTALRLYLAAGRIDDAQRMLEEYKQIAATFSDRDASEEMIALLGSFIAQAEGKPYDVIAVLQPFLTSEPKDTTILRLLAEAYQSTGQTRLADKALGLYLARTDRAVDPAAAVQQARTALRSGRFDEALSIVRNVSSGSIEVALIRIEAEMGLARLKGGSAFEQAAKSVMAEAEKLSNDHPESIEAALLLASIQANHNRDADAEKTLKQAIERSDSNPRPQLALVQLYLSMDKMAEAQALAQRACEAHPQEAAPWVAWMRALEVDKKIAAARGVLQEAEKKVTAPAARHDLAMQFARFDLDHDARPEGLARLEKLADEHPTDLVSRAALLEQPEFVADTARAQARVDEIRKIEGENGRVWRVYQSALWLADKEHWQQHEEEIRRLLEPCLDIDAGYSPVVTRLGELYERLGRLDAAETLYQRGLAANPASIEITGRLYEFLCKNNRLEEALRLSDRFPTEILAVGGESGALTPASEEEYIQQLEAQLEKNPHDVNAVIRLAFLKYQRTGDVDAALRQLEAVAGDAENTLDVASAQAAILENAGRTDEMREILNRLVEHQATFEAYLLRANFLYRAGDYTAAESDCRKLAEFPDRPDGYLQLGMFYARINRINEAIDAWENGLVKYPDDEDLKNHLMTGLLQRSAPTDRERGMQLLNELAAQKPDDPQLLGIRALLKLQEGTPESEKEAEQLLLRVVQLRPEAVDAHLKLVQIAARRNDLRTARDRLTTALQANPDAIPLILARAEIEAIGGNPTSAVALTRSVLEREAENVEALNLLAQFAVRAGDDALLGEAQRRLEPVVAKKPVDPRMIVDLAMVLAARNKNDEALRVLDQLPTGMAQADRDAALSLRVDLLARMKSYGDLAVLMRELSMPAVHSFEALLKAGAVLLASPHAEARQVAIDVLMQDQGSPSVTVDFRLDVAGVFYQAGELDRASAIYENVLSSDAAQPRACNDWAWMLAEDRKEYQRALELADRGLKTAEPSLRINLLDTRGVILTRLQRYEDARKDFEELVNLTGVDSPTNARAWLQVARVCEPLGDKAGMQRALSEARAADRRLQVFTPEEKAELERLSKIAGG